MILLVNSYLIITAIALTFYFIFSRENSFNVGMEEHDKSTFFLLSFMPLLNVLFIGTVLFILIPILWNRRKLNIKKIKEMNCFIKCDNCSVIVRQGYKVNNTCPVCEKETGHVNIIDGEKFKSNKIPEHMKFKKKYLKKEKVKELKNKSKLNESLYGQVKQKALEK